MFVVRLILLFVLPRFVNNGRSRQSNAAVFLNSTEVFAWEAIFLFIYNFFWKVHEFLRFSICSHVNERGWNFMCERTLPRLLVCDIF